jgi:hypothetical protein
VETQLEHDGTTLRAPSSDDLARTLATATGRSEDHVSLSNELGRLHASVGRDVPPSLLFVPPGGGHRSAALGATEVSTRLEAFRSGRTDWDRGVRWHDGTPAAATPGRGLGVAVGAMWGLELLLGTLSALGTTEAERALYGVPAAVLALAWFVVAVVWLRESLRTALSARFGVQLVAAVDGDMGTMWAAAEPATAAQRRLATVLDLGTVFFVFLGPALAVVLPALLIAP